MKRLLYLILSSFLLSFNVYSQIEKPDNKLLVSLSFGITKSNFVGSHIDERTDPYYHQGSYFKSEIGYSVSIQAKFLFLTDYLYARPGISYVQKGATEINKGLLIYTYKFSSELDYLSTPILIGVQPINFKNAGGRINLYFEGGIAPSLQVRRSNKDIEKGYSDQQTMSKMVLAYQIGAGFEAKLTDKVTLFANYSFVRDITPFFYVFEDPTFKAYNVVSSIAGGIIFRPQEFLNKSK